MSVSDFIKDLGGNASVARKIGIKPERVAQWIFRQKVPRTVWPDLKIAYPRKVTDRLLLEIEAAKQTQDAA